MPRPHDWAERIYTTDGHSMGTATKAAGKRLKSDELAMQAVMALRDHWKSLKMSPIKKRLDWLATNEAIIALGSKTARSLLRALQLQCQQLRIKCCPGRNYANIVEGGAPYPRGRIACKCPECRGVKEWPAIYVGSRGFSHECELVHMPIEVSSRLPPSSSGRVFTLIRLFELRVELRRTKLGWKKGARRDGY